MEVGALQLAELIKKVQAGDEVLLTQDAKPVAKLVAAPESVVSAGESFHVRSFPGHKVLVPVLSQSELAEEIFNRQ